jgi:hypothetical protein
MQTCVTVCLVPLGPFARKQKVKSVTTLSSSLSCWTIENWFDLPHLRQVQSDYDCDWNGGDLPLLAAQNAVTNKNRSGLTFSFGNLTSDEQQNMTPQGEQLPLISAHSSQRELL